MADPRGFLTTAARGRRAAARSRSGCRTGRRSTPTTSDAVLLPIISKQAGRCMDCGIPFCHQGCPLGNLIPEWNDLVYRDDWEGAIERLHATNNFPEFTGRLCPAPCETSCVLGINQDPVTIKNVEVAIVDKAWDAGCIRPQQVDWLTGKTVAVIGSGPAGLAAAQQLTRAGHTVVGLRAGRRDRRAAALRHPRVQDGEAAGRPAARPDAAGGHGLPRRCRRRRRHHRAVSCASGSTRWCSRSGATVARDLPIPGRELDGIHQAMEYLPQANRAARGEHGRRTRSPPTGKHVVVIGGGDTGADCVGTAHRQGAASVTQLEIMPRPGDERADGAAVADVPDDLSGLVGARGGRRAGVRRLDAASSSATTPAGSARCG